MSEPPAEPRDPIVKKELSIPKSKLEKCGFVGMKMGLNTSAVIRLAIDQFLQRNWRRLYGPSNYDTGPGGDTMRPAKEGA
jgi:hypothetical protein